MNTSRKLAFLALMIFVAAAMFAQSKKGDPQLRTVRGTVVDKDEVPVETAVVYLKNVRTQDITTHLSEKDGEFRFSGLDLNADYQIHAEQAGWMSTSHSISNFDTRKEYVLTLKLDHKKSGK